MKSTTCDACHAPLGFVASVPGVLPDCAGVSWVLEAHFKKEGTKRQRDDKVS